MIEHKKESITKQEDILNTNILSPINGPIPLKRHCNYFRKATSNRNLP